MLTRYNFRTGGKGLYSLRLRALGRPSADFSCPTQTPDDYDAGRRGSDSPPCRRSNGVIVCTMGRIDQYHKSLVVQDMSCRNGCYRLDIASELGPQHLRRRAHRSPFSPSRPQSEAGQPGTSIENFPHPSSLCPSSPHHFITKSRRH